MVLRNDLVGLQQRYAEAQTKQGTTPSQDVVYRFDIAMVAREVGEYDIARSHLSYIAEHGGGLPCTMQARSLLTSEFDVPQST